MNFKLAHINLGIRIKNLEKMLEENDVYDLMGNNVEKDIKKEIKRLQRIYDQEEKELDNKK